MRPEHGPVGIEEDREFQTLIARIDAREPDRGVRAPAEEELEVEDEDDVEDDAEEDDEDAAAEDED